MASWGRLTPIEASSFNEGQGKLFEETKKWGLVKDGEELRGPFKAYLLNPLIGLDRAQLGELIRTADLRISQPLAELAIVYTTRKARVKYALNAPLNRAKAVGLSEAKVEALRKLQRPPDMTPQEEAVFEISEQLNGPSPAISDATYDKAKALIGEQGIFEICVITGTYKAVGHVLAGFRVPVPNGVPDPLEGAGTEPFVTNTSPWGTEKRAPLPPILPEAPGTSKGSAALYESMKKAMGGSIDKKTGGFTGPFNGFLLSPPLGRQLSKLGGHILNSKEMSIPQKLRSIAIVTTARTARVRYALAQHVIRAREVGKLSEAKVEAMRQNQRPPDMSADEEATYDLVKELLGPPLSPAGDRISDAIYEKAKKELGEKGIFEVMVIVCFYQTIGHVLSTFRVPAPDGSDPLPPDARL